MSERAAEETTPSSALESVGMVCARAAFVALLVGSVEGIVVGKVSEGAVAGIGLATAGLWVPAALLSLLVGHLVNRIEAPVARRGIAFGLGVAFLAAVLFAFKLGASFAPPIRALPAEIVAALGLAWVASQLQLEPPVRKPVAIAGVILIAVLQLYATRWVDAHRAFAGLLAQNTMVPRVMLRSVLHRVA